MALSGLSETSARLSAFGAKQTCRKGQQRLDLTKITQLGHWIGSSAYDSSFHWGVKNAVDLHDIIVKQALRLDHRARWIWRLAPELRLHLVHDGRETVQVTDVDSEPHTILKAGALRLSNQPDIDESLTHPGVGILHQSVGCWIDALHASDKNEVTGPSAQTPCTLRLDSTGRLECFNTIWRGCLCEAET